MLFGKLYVKEDPLLMEEKPEITENINVDTQVEDIFQDHTTGNQPFVKLYIKEDPLILEEKPVNIKDKLIKGVLFVRCSNPDVLQSQALKRRWNRVPRHRQPQHTTPHSSYV